MKKSAIFLVITFFVTSVLFSQTTIKPIDSRFDSKEEGFQKYLKENLSFPQESLDKNSSGFSISSITITPDGKIDKIAIVNSIDEEIDAQISKVLEKSKRHWKASKKATENETFYVQVGFVRTNIGAEASIESPVTNEYFIEPVLIQSFNLDFSFEPLTNDTLAVMCYNELKAKNYQKSLDYINTLIRRNPYNKGYYDLRIMINRELKNNEAIMEDLDKINSFVPGYSLHALLKE